LSVNIHCQTSIKIEFEKWTAGRVATLTSKRWRHHHSEICQLRAQKYDTIRQLCEK